MKSFNLKKIALVWAVVLAVFLSFSGATGSLSREVPRKEVVKMVIFVSPPPSFVTKKFMDFVRFTCEKNGVPFLMVCKLMEWESGYKQTAVNINRDASGEEVSRDIGVMQLNSKHITWMIETFGDKGRKYNVYDNRYDNAEIGIRYLRWLNNQTLDWRLTVISYNCGLTRMKSGSIPTRTLRYAQYIVPVAYWWEEPENVRLVYL